MRLILIAAAFDWIFSVWYFPLAMYESISRSNLLDDEETTEPLSVRACADRNLLAAE